MYWSMYSRTASSTRILVNILIIFGIFGIRYILYTLRILYNLNILYVLYILYTLLYSTYCTYSVCGLSTLYIPYRTLHCLLSCILARDQGPGGCGPGPGSRPFSLLAPGFKATRVP